MGFRTLDEIRAYERTRSFKPEVYRLVRLSPGARSDLRFKAQIQEALAGAESNIAEGFRRWRAPQFAHFLGFAIGSLEEGRRRLQDGIDREYFAVGDCAEAQRLGEEAIKTTVALQTSLRQLIDRKEPHGRAGPKDPGLRTKD